MPELQRIKKRTRINVIANVFGTTIEDYLDVMRVLNEVEGVAMYEINASCPNTSHGGRSSGRTVTCCASSCAR